MNLHPPEAPPIRPGLRVHVVESDHLLAQLQRLALEGHLADGDLVEVLSGETLQLIVEVTAHA